MRGVYNSSSPTSFINAKLLSVVSHFKVGSYSAERTLDNVQLADRPDTSKI